ncbi:MAG: ParA family protein [Erysipelotrichaceae bacterium]|nr:ParA family protein [Erysipelotrichaceae bacterium]
MGKIIALANQKGGVGKTTTSINLAAGLAYLGKKVLLVDLDPQANATQGIGVREDIKKSTYELLLQDAKPEECIITKRIPPLDIIPATIDLAGSDLEMANYNQDRDKLLKAKLTPLKEKYDYILIDCPPTLGLFNTNALTAADSVIIPVQCEYYALEGLTQLLASIRMVQKVSNPKLYIEGVLLTMYDARTKLSVEVQQEVRKYFKERVYRSYIPRNIRLSEAPSYGKSIFEHDIKSEGARAYAALAKEVITKNS